MEDRGEDVEHAAAVVGAWRGDRRLQLRRDAGALSVALLRPELEQRRMELEQFDRQRLLRGTVVLPAAGNLTGERRFVLRFERDLNLFEILRNRLGVMIAADESVASLRVEMEYRAAVLSNGLGQFAPPGEVKRFKSGRRLHSLGPFRSQGIREVSLRSSAKLSLSVLEPV